MENEIPMIEFQYFKGCPNAIATLNNLKELIAEGFFQEDELKIVEVPDSESAEALFFQGSPTILFNGYDIYTGIKPVSYNYSCRVYTIEEEQTGVLSKEFIRKKIENM